VRVGAAAADIALFAGALFCGCFAAGLDVVVVEERLAAVEFARLVVGEPLSLAFARVREARDGGTLSGKEGDRRAVCGPFRATASFRNGLFKPMRPRSGETCRRRRERVADGTERRYPVADVDGDFTCPACRRLANVADVEPLI
jgi:hypothetical protein